MKYELLAPVGDWETLAAAIKAGADSVYFGIKWLNMRASSAKNFEITDLKKIMEKLHENNMKGYLTLNTVIYDHEMDKVKRILEEAKNSKVDAIIATDISVIQLCNEMDIECHISTQLSVANYETVKFFSKYSPRIVLARECTLEQIKSIKEKITKDNLNFKGRLIELEGFVHGSLCVAYSGRCFMSQYYNRLSANRGQCLQECRRKYKITEIGDEGREFLLDENYIMSPKDLCALPILDKLIEAGLTVFKIEGRAKGPEYVYTVTKIYREALNLIEKNKFNQKEALKLVKELENVFNRGFSSNFYLGVPTNDSWTKFFGSVAKEKKVKLGVITEYFPKLKVAAVKIDDGELKDNDELYITGDVTGCLRVKVNGMRVNDKEVKKANINQEVSFKVTEKVKVGDTAWLIQEKDTDKEEKMISESFEKIGIHKPFKHLKNKGMV